MNHMNGIDMVGTSKHKANCCRQREEIYFTRVHKSAYGHLSVAVGSAAHVDAVQAFPVETN